MAAAPTKPANRPALRAASRPTPSAVINAYSRLGSRAAHACGPKSLIGSAGDPVGQRRLFTEGFPASNGTALSACQLMRQAMSASRGSSGVQ